MKLSRPGIILVLTFLFITIIPGIYLQGVYGGSQWMLSFIIGGLPWSQYGFSLAFFAQDIVTGILSWILILLGYFFNALILYLIGYSIEKLYKKLRP